MKRRDLVLLMDPTKMDPTKALDMQHRSGISPQEIEDFASRMDLISKALEDIKNDTFDPLKCNVCYEKIPGYKTLEQEEIERTARVKREDERRKREDEQKCKAKQEEHDIWWHRAELRDSWQDAKKKDGETRSTSERWANRTLAAYKTRDANDYSQWSQWVPADPVSLQEKAEHEAALEKLRNRDFETKNPGFCDQFKKDMQDRQDSHNEKTRRAEQLKQKGNGFYKKKQFANALESYKEALMASPFHVAVLANMAQCYLRLDALDDCIEFCTRTLFIDDTHVKALSRRATAWHCQGNFQQAAEDMQKAFQLDRENGDIIEQHSIVVGDYEDALTHSQLEIALQGDKGVDTGLALSPSSLTELRVAMEIFHQLDKHTRFDNLHTTREIQAAWVAYDLVLPLLKTNEHVRALFRTSGQMQTLGARLSATLLVPKDERKGRHKSRSPTDLGILTTMINCATAAVANTPRNQVLLFRNVEFRHWLLAYCGSPSTTLVDPPIQARLLCFLEHVVALKSWHHELLSSNHVILALFATLYLETTATRSKHDKVATRAVALAGSSLCFTLSRDKSGIEAFQRQGGDCLAAIVQSLAMNGSVAFTGNVLGFLSNLSTHEAFRNMVDKSGQRRRHLVHLLLQMIVQDQAIVSGSWALVHVTRALGVLLNLSCAGTSLVRTRDLVDLHAVDTIESMLSHVDMAHGDAALVVWSRTISLLCRLHVKSSGQLHREEGDRLICLHFLSKLYAVAQAVLLRCQDEVRAIPNEVWQLLAQLWCHFGWCAHLTRVRAWLREMHVVAHLLQVVALAQTHRVALRSTNDRQACERLIGNVVKVVLAMESDKDAVEAWRRKTSLAVLVSTLQALPDGQARTNVAILLAKLCQSDPEVKSIVRAMRGIEMMLSIRQRAVVAPRLGTEGNSSSDQNVLRCC